MKKIVALIVFLIGLSFNLNAQPPHFDDLIILFADGQYEELLKKAEKYTLKDKTKNEPIPYMFLARANFEMSKDAKWDKKYPKAFKDAVKYAGKCRKKDKEGLVYEEYLEFFTDLKIYCVEDIRNLVESGNFTMCAVSIMTLQRFDKDIGSQFLMATCQYRDKDKTTAKLTAKEAMAQLDAVESVKDWRSVDYLMFRIGIVEYCKYFIDKNQMDKAQDLLGKTKQWMEKDEEYMDFYCQVVNDASCN